MNPRRLFVASCIALITSAFSFQIRQDITDPLKDTFAFNNQMIGEVMASAFLGMAVAMLVFAPLCDWLGMGRVLFLAWLCHLTGILGTIFAQQVAAQGFVQSAVSAVVGILPEGIRPAGMGPDKTAFYVLWLATFLVGSGNGLVEIAINPLAATLFPTEKTHYLNILHAWWPGGLILSGLLAIFVVGDDPWFGIPAWQIKMGLLLVPLLLYGLLAVGQKFPQTERVAHNVSTGTMFLQVLRPMFLIWAFCMLLTASTELGPNQWQNSVLTRTANVSGTLVFVYTSGLMFVMRFFAGPLAHKLSPVGMLTCSAILSAAGLYWLSFVDNWVMAFAAATVFGIGIAYFWPTMLGVTAERFPKGGALLLGLMGCFGNLAIWQALPQMGAIYDSFTVNALPEKLQNLEIATGKTDEKTGKEEMLKLVKSDFKTWLPGEVAARLFPAYPRTLNPDAIKFIADKSRLAEKEQAGKAEVPVTVTMLRKWILGEQAEKKPPVLDAAQQARVDEAVAIRKELVEPEKVGAAWAFRWVAVLPCVLVVIFGLIALIDKLRGGYKAVHIAGAAPKPGGPPNLDHADWGGYGADPAKGHGRVGK
jgi:MFS family permease